MLRRLVLLSPLTLVLVVALAACGSATAPTSSTTKQATWVAQFGSTQFDIGFGIGSDASGNSYVAGYTAGTLTGQTSAGGTDAILAKYDGSGNQVWLKQFGSSAGDVANGIAVDASGNSYITGDTNGTLPGQTSAGGADAFLAKYDSSGNQVWLKQFGGSADDIGSAVAVDGSGNSYVTGYTTGTLPGEIASGMDDAFLAKYDSSGNQVWLRQFGTPAQDDGTAVAVDASGNIYATGYTTGVLAGSANAGGDDAYLVKYDSSGNVLWARQFGSSGDDDAMGLAVDASGNALVTGGTSGDLGGTGNAGAFDVFLAKYDSSGAQTWLTQFGTAKDEEANAVAVDAAGNSFVTGYAVGNLSGANAGGMDAFVSEIDPAGKRVWVSQFGTSSDDGGKGVTVDGNGNALVAGYTYGGLNGANAGKGDAFLAKFVP